MTEEKIQTNQKEEEFDFLVYEYHTWGNHGQHSKTIKLIIDLEKKTQKPVWEILDTKWIRNDSRKNLHREAYVKTSELIRSLKGKILKEITDYQSSSRRKIDVRYYIITDNGLEEINAEIGVKISDKYYDILKIHDKKVLVSKDEVIIK